MVGKKAVTMGEIRCFRCGTCCIAPDISTLEKAVGVPCPHLRADRLCGIYPERPAVCRDYRPDELCVALQTLPPAARVRHFLHVYGLEAKEPNPDAHEAADSR